MLAQKTCAIIVRLLLEVWLKWLHLNCDHALHVHILVMMVTVTMVAMVMVAMHVSSMWWYWLFMFS